MPNEWLLALLGGILIGLAVSLMLYWNGRVTGISGIINESMRLKKGDRDWRLMFIAGLVLGGFVLNLFNPEFFAGQLETPDWTLAIAGLLVGFGTTMGSGCTSGHGVCGISRMSVRSLVATVTFIFAGVLAVAFFRAIGVLP
ncbi:MAG: YeeE/YedE family protein [Oligoflexus sp.]